MICSGLLLHAQNADHIVGFYYLKDPFNGEHSQIQIYKTSNGKYDGKVVWVEFENRKPYLGYVFLKNLEWNPTDRLWEEGSIKYPGKKGTYQVKAHFDGENRLRVRGFLGFSVFGLTVDWIKESYQREQK